MDSASHAIPVRVRLTPSNAGLKIGQAVTAEITIALHGGAITVPLSALVPEEDGFKVFVVDSTGIAHATAVTVGARADSVAEIVNGIAAGARVVTRGAFGVEDGARIGKPRP